MRDDTSRFNDEIEGRLPAGADEGPERREIGVAALVIPKRLQVVLSRFDRDDDAISDVDAERRLAAENACPVSLITYPTMRVSRSTSRILWRLTISFMRIDE